MKTRAASRQLVLRKLRSCFPSADAAARVREILDRYGVECWHQERDRVHLAILKECNGEVERVEKLTELACADFRDVLAGAEYPEEISRPAGSPDLAAVRERDRRQYEQWLDAD